MLNRYIIERKIPGVGASSDADLSKIAGKSIEAMDSLGSKKIQWIQSYVTDDKVYCEYFAENDEVVREHAKLAGMPADSVSKVTQICDPTTANSDLDVLRGKKSTERQDISNAGDVNVGLS